MLETRCQKNQLMRQSLRTMAQHGLTHLLPNNLHFQKSCIPKSNPAHTTEMQTWDFALNYVLRGKGCTYLRQSYKKNKICK